jgi:50S ribosomal subunit-associated GTPase HflX
MDREMKKREMEDRMEMLQKDLDQIQLERNQLRKKIDVMHIDQRFPD